MSDWRSCGFPASLRLRTSAEFGRVRRYGRKVQSPHFIVYWLPADGAPTRLGVTVSRKVGGAVQRNRVKRLLREFFRLHRRQLTRFGELSIIARKGASRMNLGEVTEELLVCLSTAEGGRRAP